MSICIALEITLEQLLTGEGIDDVTEFEPISDRTYGDKADAKLFEDYHGMQEGRKKIACICRGTKKIESLEELNLEGGKWISTEELSYIRQMTDYQR